VLVIRIATRNDIDAIGEIRNSVRENRLTSSVITAEDVRIAIEEQGRGWVAEDAGRVVAFAIGRAADRNVWALFVHPDFEGRGYGRALHAEMVNWFNANGSGPIWLTTDPNTRAERFYLRLGWRVVGEAEFGEIRLERNALLSV
jgi:GNAT superfamily N-acetyltransferase